MRKAIDQDTLEALISTGAMREFRVVRHHGAWALQGEPAEFGKNRTLSHSRRFVIM